MIEISYLWAFVFVCASVFLGYWIGKFTMASTWVKLAMNKGTAIIRVIPGGLKYFRVVEVNPEKKEKKKHHWNGIKSPKEGEEK